MSYTTKTGYRVETENTEEITTTSKDLIRSAGRIRIDLRGGDNSLLRGVRCGKIQAIDKECAAQLTGVHNNTNTNNAKQQIWPMMASFVTSFTQVQI